MSEYSDRQTWRDSVWKNPPQQLDNPYLVYEEKTLWIQFESDKTGEDLFSLKRRADRYQLWWKLLGDIGTSEVQLEAWRFLLNIPGGER